MELGVQRLDPAAEDLGLAGVVGDLGDSSPASARARPGAAAGQQVDPAPARTRARSIRPCLSETLNKARRTGTTLVHSTLVSLRDGCQKNRSKGGVQAQRSGQNRNNRRCDHPAKDHTGSVRTWRTFIFPGSGLRSAPGPPCRVHRAGSRGRSSDGFLTPEGGSMGRSLRGDVPERRRLRVAERPRLGLADLAKAEEQPDSCRGRRDRSTCWSG